MRRLLRELAGCALLLVALPAAAVARQESVQVSAAVHSLHGEPLRVGTQPTLEPDLGLSWLRPDTRFGTLRIELRGTTRDGRPHLGRAVLSLRDLTLGGVRYTLEAGDSVFSPEPGDYRFRNLYTPALNFSGASLRARAGRTDASVMLGRATTTRNIFGSDVKTLDQSLFIATGRHQASDRLEISSRASRVRTRDLDRFRFSIADSDQAGGGARFLLTPAVHLVADASLVAWRARDGVDRHVDGSALAGASVLLARGWLQVNVSRFSPGELPILAQPLADRRTLYAAGEYDVLPRMRLFGGWESFRANLDGRAASGAPPTDGGRAFGGIRVPIGPGSSASFRAEQGDRRSRLAGPAQTRISDTGVISGDVQGAFGRVSAFGRIARRENVESEFEPGTYTQREAAALAFYNVSRSLQLFSSLTAVLNESTAGGHTSWQLGGGAQAQLLRRGLWARGEGLFTRNVDRLNDRTTPHQTINVGLNGEIARGIVLALNVYADRMHTGLDPALDSWLLRSTVRLTRTFVEAGTPARARLGVSARHGGTGSIRGLVYTDWNANGLQDPDEPPLENIPIRLASLGHTSTSQAGEFAFVNVPIGVQEVGIDLASLPVDFDAPRVPQVQVELRRGDARRLSFGLVPLGAIAGRVRRDANGSGAADDGDDGMDGAVVVLDGGARSEKVRGGRFRFDAVPSGDHEVTLLQESLPDGAVIIGPRSNRAAIGRDELAPEIAFLVDVRERPEIRTVFPTAPPAAPAARPRTPARSPARPIAAARPSRAGQFAVQVAALNDPSRAAALVEELRAAGRSAYLVSPPFTDPDAPYRVRVGPFDSRAAAGREAIVLGSQRGGRMWVVRER